MRNSAPKLIQGFSLLGASNARNIKPLVMQVALIFARDTGNSLITLALGGMSMLVGLLAIVEIVHQRLSANPQAAVLLSWWFSCDVGNWYQTGCLRMI